VVLLCELKWRRDDVVGVKFLDRQGPHAPTAEAMEKLQGENARLRRENARLKTRVEELIGGFYVQPGLRTLRIVPSLRAGLFLGAA
jgi:hypothetical protein